MKTENRNNESSSYSNTQEDERKGNRNQGENRNQGDTSNRGFASMSEEEQREIASKGGKAAHEQGVAHEWTSEEAREAGRKGGQASHGGGNQGSPSGGRSSEYETSGSSSRSGSNDDDNKGNRSQSR